MNLCLFLMDNYLISFYFSLFYVHYLVLLRFIYSGEEKP